MMCAILRCSNNELLGLNWLSRVTDHDRERVHTAWEDGIEDNRDFDIDFYCQYDNGNMIQKVRLCAVHVATPINVTTKYYVGTIMALDKSTPSRPSSANN